MELSIASLSILLFLIALYQPSVKGKRVFPWCVNGSTLVEYKASGLEQYVTEDVQKNFALKIMDKFENNVNSTIRNFTMTRIRNTGMWTGVRVMKQWIHITISTTVPMKGLLVQAISAPYALPDGIFDLEFGCNDCGDGINPGDATTKNALPGKIVPCSKRAYINARHPTVYAFDNENEVGKAMKKRFHMNFNFLDITCRHIKMLQFLILAVAEKTVEMIYTPVIDHDFVDSQAGMPWPFHSSIATTFKCHVPDEELTIQERINLFMMPLGNKFFLSVNEAYDRCVQTGESTSELSPNWLCDNPGRMKCDMSSPINIPSTVTSESKKKPAMPPEPPAGGKPADSEDVEDHGDPGAEGGATLCPECAHSATSAITREAYRRFAHRGYLARRFHGVAMIFGCIAALVVSIHIARYFKEAGGGHLLVGWWMWTHLGLTFFGTMSVWIGFSVAVAMRPRYTSDNTNRFIGERRTALMKIHTIIGYATLFVYHAILLNGFSRPMNAYWRRFMIWSHSLGGHLQLVLAAAAVIFSTACVETVLWTLIILIFSFILLVVAMVIHLQMYDKNVIMDLHRSYFPVIEAIRVPNKMPAKYIRIAILLILILFTLVCFAQIVVKGSHHGYHFSPCQNCRWKYDELLVKSQTPKATASWYFHEAFGCKYDKSVWQKTISLL